MEKNCLVSAFVSDDGSTCKDKRMEREYIKADTLKKEWAVKNGPQFQNIIIFREVSGNSQCGKFTLPEKEFDVKRPMFQPMRRMYFTKTNCGSENS